MRIVRRRRRSLEAATAAVSTVAAEAEAEVEAEAEAEAVAEAEVKELPESDATLAMTYAPAFHLDKEQHDRIHTCPRHFIVHGVYDDKSLPPSLQNLINEEEVENFQFDVALRGRLYRLIPKIGDNNSERLMKREMKRHGANVTFLTTVADYTEFALDVYERYQFVGLSDFIVQTATRECIVRREVQVGLPWIGVSVRDVIRIANSYPPIEAVNGQVNWVLIERSGGRLFPYEITFCVTKEGLPGRRRRQVEVYRKGKKRKAKVVSPDSYVFFVG